MYCLPSFTVIQSNYNRFMLFGRKMNCSGRICIEMNGLFCLPKPLRPTCGFTRYVSSTRFWKSYSSARRRHGRCKFRLMCADFRCEICSSSASKWKTEEFLHKMLDNALTTHTIVFFRQRIHETDKMANFLCIENKCFQRSFDGPNVLLDNLEISLDRLQHNVIQVACSQCRLNQCKGIKID